MTDPTDRPGRVDIDDLADAEARAGVVDQQTAAEADIEQAGEGDAQDVLPDESAAHPS